MSNTATANTAAPTSSASMTSHVNNNNAIPFCNFDPTSPLTTSPHDPMVSLASNCIRDYFGPTVQLVADALLFRGTTPITFRHLITVLRQKCPPKIYSAERVRLLGRKVALRLQNQTLQEAPLRAALLVLVQHSIVKVTLKTVNKKIVYFYEFDKQRARLLPRYPRYVEYAKKALDVMAAALVEELLVQGQLRTVDAIQKTVARLESLEAGTLEENPTDNAATTTTTNATTTTMATATATTASRQQAVLESFKRLKQAGFLEQVSRLVDEDLLKDQMEEMEFEQDAPKEPPRKKARTDGNQQTPTTNEEPLHEQEDPAIVALLSGNSYKDVLPRNAVWRVNVHMFHDSLRAFILGRLVAERYGHKVQSAGSMVTAALKYLANRKHAINANSKKDSNNQSNFIEEQTFDAASIVRYIPKPVMQLLEKKRKDIATSSTAGAGGNHRQNQSIIAQVARSLQQLSAYKSPGCILEVETGAKPEDSKFEISVARMVQYLQSRIVNQMVADHHGQVAARIVTILTLNGHLESDSLAEAAMVPAKDTREILHRLYRTKYISLFTLNTSRQHNPSSMIYLWRVVGPQIIQTATDNVCTALLNLRLRRQHQVEIGKNWIERAQEAGDMDENDHEADKLNHKKFCLGLERLYNSCLQVDETLMVLEDF